MLLLRGGPTNYKYFDGHNIIDFKITDQPAVVLGFGNTVTAPGKGNFKKEIIERPNGRKDYLLFYIKKGRHEIKIAGKKEIFGPNSLVLYRPEEPQCYQQLDNESSTFFVHFTGGQIEQLLEKYHVTGPKITFKEEFKVFEEVVNKLEAERANPFLEELSNSLLIYLLIMIGTRQNASQENLNSNRFVQMLELMAATCHENRPIEYYANFFGYSRGYFIRFFKTHMHHTPQQHIALERLKKAKYALLHTDKGITQISQELGFNDVHYFYKFFKSHIGQTPSDYRKDNKGE